MHDERGHLYGYKRSCKMVHLRTIDALHIVIAKKIAAEVLVTADHIMAEGTEASGLRVVRF